MVGYLKHRGIDITPRTQWVDRLGTNIGEPGKGSVSEGPTLGRYYSRIGLELFLYLDEGQESIGRDILMEESSLFRPMSAWSVSRRMAIFRLDDETSLSKMEEKLTGRGFERIHASRDDLEEGFKTGDLSPVINRRKILV